VAATRAPLQRPTWSAGGSRSRWCQDQRAQAAPTKSDHVSTSKHERQHHDVHSPAATRFSGSCGHWRAKIDDPHRGSQDGKGSGETQPVGSSPGMIKSRLVEFMVRLGSDSCILAARSTHSSAGAGTTSTATTRPPSRQPQQPPERLAWADHGEDLPHIVLDRPEARTTGTETA
jgi:hypothetical protein